MKYESPQLQTLTDAVNAIQTIPKQTTPNTDNGDHYEVVPAYQDWET